MTAQKRIVLLQFKPPGVITPVLLRDVKVPALSAFQFDNDSVALFCHVLLLAPSSTGA
jgi:hypothetical protein